MFQNSFYSFLRILNWTFEFITSALGIAAFISLIGLMLPPYTIDSCLPEDMRLKRVKINDRNAQTRKWLSWIILIISLVISVVHYAGPFHVEDVFNGEYKYVGQTLNSKADGHGKKLTLEDTLIYEGDFVANNFDGNGKFYKIIEQEDGSEINRLRYEGDFKSGVYEGEGKQYYALQTDDKPVLKYEGMFKNGLYHGMGKLYNYIDDNDKMAVYLDSVYDCEWKDGEKDGEGEYTKYNENADIIEHYKGRFKNDAYDGVGIWEFYGENHNYYEGKNVFYGLFESGTIVEGVYYSESGSGFSAKAKGEGDEADLIKKYPFPIDNVWNEDKGKQ